MHAFSAERGEYLRKQKDTCFYEYVLPYLRQTEIGDLDVPVFVEQYVARLEVVVDDRASPVLPLTLQKNKDAQSSQTHCSVSRGSKSELQGCRTF